RTLSFDVASTIGGLLDVIGTQIPGVQARLDELAGALVAQVNALHSTGYTPAGATGVDFFDPAGTTARTIRVAVATADVVSTDAAGETGNNRIALALAGLRGKPAGNTPASAYAAWNAVSNN